MTEIQRQVCEQRKAVANCKLAGEIERLQAAITALQKDVSGLDEQLLARDKQYGSVALERDRYLTLLKEVATAKDHTEQREKMAVKYHYTLESIQRHVREQFDKWRVPLDD